MTPMYLIFAGAIIIVIGTVITAVGTLWQNKASSEKSTKQLDKIEELTMMNAELSNQLAEASQFNYLMK